MTRDSLFIFELKWDESGLIEQDSFKSSIRPTAATLQAATFEYMSPMTSSRKRTLASIKSKKDEPIQFSAFEQLDGRDTNTLLIIIASSGAIIRAADRIRAVCRLSDSND